MDDDADVSMGDETKGTDSTEFMYEASAYVSVLSKLMDDSNTNPIRKSLLSFLTTLEGNTVDELYTYLNTYLKMSTITLENWSNLLKECTQSENFFVERINASLNITSPAENLTPEIAVNIKSLSKLVKRCKVCFIEWIKSLISTNEIPDYSKQLPSHLWQTLKTVSVTKSVQDFQHLLNLQTLDSKDETLGSEQFNNFVITYNLLLASECSTLEALQALWHMAAPCEESILKVKAECIQAAIEEECYRYGWFSSVLFVIAENCTAISSGEFIKTCVPLKMYYDNHTSPTDRVVQRFFRTLVQVSEIAMAIGVAVPKFNFLLKPDEMVFMCSNDQWKQFGPQLSTAYGIYKHLPQQLLNSVQATALVHYWETDGDYAVRYNPLTLRQYSGSLTHKQQYYEYCKLVTIWRVPIIEATRRDPAYTPKTRRQLCDWVVDYLSFDTRRMMVLSESGVLESEKVTCESAPTGQVTQILSGFHDPAWFSVCYDIICIAFVASPLNIRNHHDLSRTNFTQIELAAIGRGIFNWVNLFTNLSEIGSMSNSVQIEFPTVDTYALITQYCMYASYRALSETALEDNYAQIELFLRLMSNAYSYKNIKVFDSTAGSEHEKFLQAAKQLLLCRITGINCRNPFADEIRLEAKNVFDAWFLGTSSTKTVQEIVGSVNSWYTRKSTTIGSTTYNLDEFSKELKIAYWNYLTNTQATSTDGIVPMLDVWTKIESDTEGGAGAAAGAPAASSRKRSAT